MWALKRVFEHRYPKHDGFILLEIMVSISIIAIVFVSLFRMQSSTIDLAATGKFQSIAPFLAQMQLAEIEANLVNGSESSGHFGEDFKGYEWACSVSEVSFENAGILREESLKNLKKIDLTITGQNENNVYKVTTWRYADADE